MKAFRKWVSLVPAILCITLAGIHDVPAQVSADQASSKMAGHSQVPFSHSLPQLDGGHLKVSVVEVIYGPGESSPPHSHPCAVIGHIVEGAYRTQVKGDGRGANQRNKKTWVAQ